MKGLVGVWKFVVFTNLLIASAAASQVLLSYAIFQIPLNSYIVVLEFCATLLLYNLSIWLSKPKDYSQSPFERTRWIFGNLRWFWIFNSLAVLASCSAFLKISFETQIYLIFIGVISLVYALPIVKLNGQWKSFRHVPYAKVFHIALIWSLSTVGLVYIESYEHLQEFDWSELLYLLLCKFLFILFVTLPFDIRDVKQDSYYHLKTLPVALGVSKAQNICYIFGMLHMLFVAFMPTAMGVKLGMIACDILVIYLLRSKIFKQKDSFLNVYLLDFVLVIQYVFCLLSLQIINYFIR